MSDATVLISKAPFYEEGAVTSSLKMNATICTRLRHSSAIPMLPACLLGPKVSHKWKSHAGMHSELSWGGGP
jgi:hypothetical protein